MGTLFVFKWRGKCNRNVNAMKNPCILFPCYVIPLDPHVGVVYGCAVLILASTKGFLRSHNSNVKFVGKHKDLIHKYMAIQKMLNFNIHYKGWFMALWKYVRLQKSYFNER